MNKLDWCKQQKDGIKLIEPNEKIGRSYLKESEEDFSNLKNSTLKWKNIMGYYACYNAFYGLLQKIGIKSEIHDCTLELVTLFESLVTYKKFLQQIKSSRIDVQYHLKKPKEINETEVSKFIIECQTLFDEISYDEIIKIRNKLTVAT